MTPTRIDVQSGAGPYPIQIGAGLLDRLRREEAPPREELERDGLAAYLPDRANCTDNAAMVAAAGWWQLQRAGESPLDTGADPGLGLGSPAA